MEISSASESETAGNRVSVLIVDQSIDSSGIIANCALVLGLTAGRELSSDTFGQDVVDGDGRKHTYLTKIGHLVRKAGQSKIRTLREVLSSSPNTIVIDYTEDAAPADYSEYSRNLVAHKGEEIKYRAIYVYGPEQTIVPLTKNLSRL